MGKERNGKVIVRNEVSVKAESQRGWGMGWVT